MRSRAPAFSAAYRLSMSTQLRGHLDQSWLIPLTDEDAPHGITCTGGDARSAWAKAPADAGPLSTRASCVHRGRGVRATGHGGGGRGRARTCQRQVSRDHTITSRDHTITEIFCCEAWIYPRPTGPIQPWINPPRPGLIHPALD